MLERALEKSLSYLSSQASEFDLMQAVSFDSFICLSLTKKWKEIQPKTSIV